jgi:hypothetical protein
LILHVPSLCGKTLTNQNSIHEEIKDRLKSGHDCYHSVQNTYIEIKMYRTIILPVVLCGCETWSLRMRKEHTLRVFENRMLRRIFGEWRRLHNEELYELYPSLNIISLTKHRRVRWAGHVERMEERRDAYRVLVGKPDGKRTPQRPRRKQRNIIKMDLREVGRLG